MPTDRKVSIGSSDAAAVLGLSRWSTPLHVWAEKTGQIVPDDISDRVSVKLGNKLEQTVAELFMEETGKVVNRVNEPQVHAKYPFLTCQIDRRVVGEDALLECKTASAWKAKEWAGEEIPQEYIIQVYHQLAVTGKKHAYIAVLIGNQDFIWKEIKRDEKIINEIVAKEVHFWNTFVMPKVMPGQITANDSETLFNLFPNAKPVTVELTDETTKLIEQRNAMIQDVEALEKQIDQAENEIKAQMKDAESATAGKWDIKWATQTSIRLDTERIKTEAPELYSKFGKESKCRKLTIREATNGKH